MTHYIHRPTPEGGETDPRFREATPQYILTYSIECWGQLSGWYPVYRCDSGLLPGAVWRRIPGSDAPSAELQALARATRDGV